MSDEPIADKPAPNACDLAALLAMSDRDLLKWREEAREIVSQSPDPFLAALYRATNDEICVRAEKAWAVAMHGGQEDRGPEE